MSAMRDALRDYLAMRRALGFKLVSDGTGLSSFVTFLEDAQAEYISTQLALAWAQTPTSVQPARWARRLGFVRGFARYCAAIDPRTEAIPVGLLPFEYQRRAPYIFSDKDIEVLLQAALALPAKDGLANHTYHCLLGLLSVTGLRISEAVNLTLDDVDLVDGILTIRSLQVREVPNDSAAPFHRDGAGRLPGTAGQLPDRPAGSILVRQSAGEASPMRHRRRNVPSFGQQAWFGRQEWATTSASTRSSAPICHDNPYAVVWRRPGRRAAAARPVSLSRPRRGPRHLLVSLRLSGAFGCGQG